MMRFGLIGTGLMAQEHIRNLLLRPDIIISALVDPEPSSIDWARRTLGPNASGAADFSDVPSLLDAGIELDAVIICSPNHTHREVLTPLFGRKLHILCEKPLATSIEDARWIADRARDHPGIFWVGMEYRYMPPVSRFIEELKGGRAGRLVRLALHEHRFPFLPKVGDWNRFNRNTGGTMVEKCCHFFDLMRFIIGAEPTRVFCSGAMDVNHLDERYEGEKPDIIDNSFTIVDFAGGQRAMLDLCMFAEGSEEQEELVAIGDKAKLSVGIPSGALTYAPRVGLFQPKRIERETIEVAAAVLAAGHHHGATYFQHGAFLAAIAGIEPVALSAKDGVIAVAMGVAAERSASEGRAVELSEILD
jgi:myo-inositol 2-dehydrogenase/D-chiro-inositol 1-dehydrogenase